MRKDFMKALRLISGTQVFYHLVGVQDVAADLGAPFDFLFLAFEFGLLFLALLELQVVEV